MENKVELVNETLGTLLLGDKRKRYNLKIPEYQRTYCWDEKQVVRLLDDILNHADKTYHMGSIILHKRDQTYDIVDGQQRLVTLSLILQHLEEGGFPFLDERFESEIAQHYVAYNKWLIGNYIPQNSSSQLKTNIQNNLSFSVLILESDHLDLAYTFFTSENGRGMPLTDYDLLKSHHLRYIFIDSQAKHLAGRWDDLLLKSNNDDTSQSLGRTFEICLFRLRKWMRKGQWDEYKKRKVKNEFEAAPIIPEIPPFGEQFHFYESIQGGAHFFAFAEHFIYRFNQFKETPPCKVLHEHLSGEKHVWYRDVIEALLFGYYLKFGMLYLNEACVLITRVISQHRYDAYRAYIHSVLAYAGDTEIVMMTDQATSPTFFLAEMIKEIKKMPVVPGDLSGTRARYHSGVRLLTDKLLGKDPIKIIVDLLITKE